jgi:hypothetical protein
LANIAKLQGVAAAPKDADPVQGASSQCVGWSTKRN